MSAPTITKLSFGRNASPIGIGQSRPLLSWRFSQGDDTEQDWLQVAYELRITRNNQTKTHSVQSDVSIDAPWPEEEADLISREGAKVTVRVQGKSGSWTDWYGETVEAALLDPEEWKAAVVAPVTPPPKHLAKRPFHVRRRFHLDTSSGIGRIYATALGVYQLYLNGEPIGDHVLAPGWQSYNHRLHYQTYEIPPDLLRQGENTLEAVVGEGWYAGRLTWQAGCRNIWGSEIGVMVQLEMDGKVVVISDDTWEWTYGPILSSELYDGETYDAGIDLAPQTWQGSKTIPLPSTTRLITPEPTPIRRTQTLRPLELIKTPSGKSILDFGQNLVGWVKITGLPSKVRENDAVRLRFAEVLEHGELGARPLRSAKCTDTIYLGDKEVKEWEPLFTSHGFRYCEVTGPKELLDRYEDAFEAVVIHSDMERIGEFECSHEMVNQLHRNVVWGLRGNFVGLPTDCPQRDER